MIVCFALHIPQVDGKMVRRPPGVRSNTIEKSHLMSQTPVWLDITDEIREAGTPMHDRVVAIMNSLDGRYRGLGTVWGNPAERRTRLTEWVNQGRDGQRVRMIGATYAEECGGPLRRVFGVLHDVDPNSPAWINMRVETLGHDHEYAEHRDAAQWNAAIFESWYRDIRRALVGLGTSGDPMKLPPEPRAVRIKAYVPATMAWEPMKQFHDYIFTQLDQRRGGSLIHPSRFRNATDWVDYDFVVDCS